MKLIKFEASWCQPCKMLARTLEDVTLPWPIVPVDIDENQEAAITYGVRGVPTMLLLDENENILLRVNGYKTKTELETAFAPFATNA
jgi:thioredoxin 1